jgi:hypothetical protein
MFHHIGNSFILIHELENHIENQQKIHQVITPINQTPVLFKPGSHTSQALLGLSD